MEGKKKTNTSGFNFMGRQLSSRQFVLYKGGLSQLNLKLNNKEAWES